MGENEARIHSRVPLRRTRTDGSDVGAWRQHRAAPLDGAPIDRARSAARRPVSVAGYYAHGTGSVMPTDSAVKRFRYSPAVIQEMQYGEFQIPES